MNAPIPRPVIGRTGAAVAVRDLHKAFGAVRAVDGVTLEIGAGEFVALLGPSGSGKTTILMTIAGFETPDRGRVEIAGTDVTGLTPARRSIGMVFQRYALFPHMNVAENVAFPLKMRHVGRAEATQRVEAALALVRLEGYGGRRTHQLSGGQQQRVALARAIVYDPPVLLMDEPLGALDKNLREEMQLEIKHLQQKLGTTVIYVTHDQAEALTMADRIAVLSDGRVQQYAAPREVYERPANAFVGGFVGETNFIAGRLVEDNGRWLFVPDGVAQPVELAGAEAAGTWRAGACRLAVRPEQVRIASEPDAPGLPGTLEETIYGGGTLACIVRLAPGLAMTARIPAGDGPLLRPGTPVRVAWPARRVRVFQP